MAILREGEYVYAIGMGTLEDWESGRGQLYWSNVLSGKSDPETTCRIEETVEHLASQDYLRVWIGEEG